MKALIFFTFFSLLGGVALAQHRQFTDIATSDSYDYMATNKGYIQSDDGKWAFVNFNIQHSLPNNVGGDAYSFLIKYASQYEPNDFYLGRPKYMIHLIAPGQYRRIGYVEGMLLLDDKIALMTEDDADSFQRHIELNLYHHDRTEDMAEESVHEIFNQEIETTRIEEAESIQRAQHHFTDIARRYPYELRREYSGAKMGGAESSGVSEDALENSVENSDSPKSVTGASQPNETFDAKADEANLNDVENIRESEVERVTKEAQNAKLNPGKMIREGGNPMGSYGASSEITRLNADVSNNKPRDDQRLLETFWLIVAALLLFLLLMVHKMKVMRG